MIKISITSCLIIVLLLLFTQNTYAMIPYALKPDTKQMQQASFSVSPVIQDLQLFPGKITSYKLTITNISFISLGIHATAEKFSESGDNIYSNSPLPSWITLNPSDIILAPAEKKIIQVTITPPTNTRNGGYYGMVFLTPFFNSQQIINEPVILSKIGTLIFGTVGEINYDNLIRKISIVGFKADRLISETRDITLSFGIRNDYFTHLTTTPTIVITPLLFGAPQVINLEEKHILPGTMRVWKQPIHLTTVNIFYQAKLITSLGEGKQIFATTYIVILPYKILMFLLFLAFIVYIIIYKRNNFEKAFKILIK